MRISIKDLKVNDQIQAYDLHYYHVAYVKHIPERGIVKITLSHNELEQEIKENHVVTIKTRQ